MGLKSLKVEKTIQQIAQFYDSLAELAGDNWQQGMITPAHHQARIDKTLEFFKARVREHDNILDLGCSQGYLTNQYSKYVPWGTITGVDISSKAISFAEQHNTDFNIRYICSSVEDVLSSPDTPKYDIVIATEILEHVVDYDYVIRRMLAIGNYILISVPVNEEPNPDAFNLDKFGRETKMGDATGHIHHFTYDSLAKYFTKEIDYWTNGIHMVIGGK